MSDDVECPIWGTRATVAINPATMARTVDSPRAAGKYFISDSAKAILLNKSDSVKALLTTWLIDQREQGNEWPEISSETIKQIEQRQQLPVHERADRLLMYFARKSPSIGRSAVTYPFGDTNDATVQEMLAWSESIFYDEFYFLLEYLAERGWLDDAAIKKTGNHRTIITVPGYARLAELDAVNKDSSQGFVAMWFPDTKNKDYSLIKNAYDQGIYAGIDQAGYTPYRVDRDEHNDQITDKIISEIKRSKFLIADFTHGDTGARGGVYYEAGFAKGLNIPVIFTCLEKRFSTEIIHFDISHQNFILWKTPDDLREKIKNRITGSEIGWGPDKSSKA